MMWQVLKHSSFARLFFATFVSESGTQIHRVALLVLVYTLTQDALWVSLVLAAQLLATVGVGPAISAWSETKDRRHLLIASDLARAVLVPLIPLVGIHSWGILLILVFVIDILRNLHDPIANAVLPELVPEKSVDSANGLMLFTQRFTEIAAVGFGGLLVALIGAVPAFWFDALTYLVSGLILWGLPRLEPAQAKGNDYWSRVREGIQYLIKTSIIRKTVGTLFAAALFGSVEGVLGVVLAISVLNVGSTGFGVMEAAMAVGAVLGTLIVPRMTAKIPREQLFLLGLLLLGLSEASIGITTAFAWIVAAYFLSGFTNMAFLIPARSILQLNTPKELRTRIFAAFSAVMRSAVLVGTLMGGALEKAITAPPIFLVAGSIVTLVALIGLFTRNSAQIAVPKPATSA